ncbi:MAG: hypothetical protein IJP62_10260 [Treponema sp.]|nr:hypothetical protein [Treponema sp.]
MALLDCDAEAKKFEALLKENFYAVDRSQNSEVDYAAEKMKRDTAAVEEFAQSELFRELFACCRG